MMTPDLASLPWRVGRHVGRTVYAVMGTEASDDDVLIGTMDTRELAVEVVDAHNCRLGPGRQNEEIREGLAAAGRSG